MRSVNIFILIFVMMLTFPSFGEETQKDVVQKLIEGEIIIRKLSSDNPGNRSHSIFASTVEFEEDGEKKIMCCWSEETGLKNIYYTVKLNKPEAVWSTPAKASFTVVDSKTPNMVVDPKKPHIVHLVWADGESRKTKDIYHSRYFDKQWHGKTSIIPHPNNDSFPIATVLDNGMINVAWEFMLPNPVTKKFDNTYLRSGNSWTTDDNQTEWDDKGHTVSTNKLDHATHIDMASRGLRSYAAWQEGTSGHRVIMFAEKIQKEGEDDHWTWPIKISTDKHSFWPKITVDSHDNPHVMWGELGGKYGYNSRIFGDWTGPTALNHGYAKRDFFDIKADDSDMLHAVFRGDAMNVYYSAKSANDLGPWAQEVKVAGGRDCSHMSITCCSKGYAHINYSDIPVGASHSKDIWYATFVRAKDTVTGYPKADFTMSPADETIIEGMSITFDASPSTSAGGEISSYHWNFGDFYDDDNYAEGEVATHTFNKEGEYKVTLSVVDLVKNLIGNKSVTIKVISSPMPPVNVVASTFYRRGFLSLEWVNKIEWQDNPQNTELGFTVETYRIYKREKGTDGEWIPIADLSPSTLYYNDTGFPSQLDAALYQYGVSTIAIGLESTIAPAVY